MRVISGKFGSRNLKSVPGNKTRPTTDKVKESLFNMIGPYFNGGNFLDLFSGSGAVAIEAVSRGFDKATLVDKQYAAIKTINENVNITKQDQSFNVLKMNAENALQSLSNQNEKFDIIFLDPPYKDQKMIKQLQEIYELKLINENGMVICETDDNVSLIDDVNHYRLSQQKQYGITIISIYKLQG
ncbi:16S rRNA (guanine(966)-N(2))-methyltransferase RsmD [Apilactobacillus micheneri]|uniref:16S rRNA (Guanine(966)-N(2))-methyltransferase RsmD n=1 Tax=Apilactobacillus micheneri TaxID=1899430 RepID=A0A9Q8MU50_9LACO|nr:16S rRNA (guanine(966)-N(2))-methyltransferase RsmD [Apilactobacillus micheneri]TPR40776.1 16S rRNA (guanine(966)-N(2))-methyltransferase RsmD [Apilactobacillus micheneri]TPR44898.1 16S rRNA (guanine(966)-N(2))-methyltransferase RsmD [Apilactobacillus micheneri]TPR45197.1 16S rRNA (guanine(966)-N(2))-methyltransferase RsmD [Apilactobacillus micheneri]TPR46539.1 16S rRNA (guanine(966)-N(2))-methyltransferase RsmD [Apilactobacillus micheneri]TPR48455.1 16S rRNA (guanine(966)-N(2))-methyltrans